MSDKIQMTQPIEIIVGKEKQEVSKVNSMNEDVFDDILFWISDGNTLREYCRQPGKPNWGDVYKYINNDRDRQEKFRLARQAGIDAIAEDTIRMVDEYPEKIQGDRIDPGWVQWRRIQVEQRLKLISKWDPKRYGDRVSMDHAGGVSISVVTGVPNEPDQLPE